MERAEQDSGAPSQRHFDACMDKHFEVLIGGC